MPQANQPNAQARPANIEDDIMAQTGMLPKDDNDNTNPDDEEEGDEPADTAPGGAGEEDDGGDEGQPDRGGKPAANGADKPGAKPAAKPQGKQAAPGGQPKELKPGDPGYNAARRVDFDKQRLQRDFQTTRTNLDTVTRERDTLKAANDAFLSANRIATENKMDADEIDTAMQYFAEWKKDPVGTVAGLLTEMKAAGIDTSKIMPHAVDTAAIQRLIREEFGSNLKPIKDQHDSQQATVEARQAATASVDEFCESTPEALPFLDLCAALIEQDPVSYPNLRQAWSAVLPQLLRQGVDPETISYEEARRLLQSPHDKPAAKPGAKPAQRKPIPNGNRPITGGEERRPTQAAPELASEDQSYAEIIKGVMREKGLKVNF